MLGLNNVMLVSLNISAYGARRYDKKVSNEVAKQHKAKETVGRYNKCLIDPEAESFKALEKSVREAREYHYKHTLPWAQDGSRILPSLEYDAYSVGLAELKEKFEAAREVFFADWPRLKANAKIELNGLYNEDDYPPIHVLRKRFDFNVVFFPVPAAEDFRVQLNETEVEVIRDRITEEVQGALANANQDLWRRLHEAVSHMAESLSDPDRRFNHTLVGNVRELVELLPRLNFANDTKLEALRAEAEKSLIAFSPETLREDKTARADVAAKAREIERKMKAFMGAAA